MTGDARALYPSRRTSQGAGAARIGRIVEDTQTNHVARPPRPGVSHGDGAEPNVTEPTAEDTVSSTTPDGPAAFTDFYRAHWAPLTVLWPEV